MLTPILYIYGDQPTHRREGTWGISGYLGIGRSFIVGTGKEYNNHSIGNRDNNRGINLFLNPKDNHTIGLRIEQNQEQSKQNAYFSGLFDIGFYEGSTIYNRPNVELFYKYHILDSSFYISPILGISSPSKTKYTRVWALDFRLDPFIRNNLSPYGMDYRVSSRFYGGLDLGYGFTFFDHFYLNFGWMVKVASRPRIRSSYNFDFVTYSFTDLDLRIENAMYSQFVLQSVNRDMTDARNGSSSIYIEAGLVF